MEKKDIITPKCLFSIISLAFSMDYKGLVEQLKGIYPIEDTKRLASSLKQLF
jgi:hypothetical protein